MYIALAREYKMPPSVSAEQTPYQQIVLLRGIAGGGSTESFANLEEYSKWLTDRTKPA